jgi:preprotein translocase subunit SecA
VLSHIEIRVSRPEEAEVARAPQPMRETRQDPALVPAGAMVGAMAGAGAGPATAARPQAGNGNGPAGVFARQPASPALQPRMPESNWGKVPRNAPCPCGSGKKFKQCHGKV